VIFPILHLSNNLKKKKRNINIDLAVLPSHDKELAKDSPVIQAIDYASGCKVVLTVDISYIAVGYILSQIKIDKKQYFL